MAYTKRKSKISSKRNQNRTTLLAFLAAQEKRKHRRLISKRHLQGEPCPQYAALWRWKGDSMNEEPYKICLRLNADEAQKLITNAKACGLTRTAYLRRLLNGYDLKPRPSAELEALRTEIHQIGNNINQIARKANLANVCQELFSGSCTEKRAY